MANILEKCMMGLPGTGLKSREYRYLQEELRHKPSFDGS